MPNRFLYYIDKFLSIFDISWLVAKKPKEPPLIPPYEIGAYEIGAYDIGPYEYDIGPYEPLLEPKN